MATILNKVPYIRQTRGGGWYNFSKKKYENTNWPNQSLGHGRTIRSSGCGLCCTAMATSYQTGKKINPIDFKKWYVPGGSLHQIGKEGAALKGELARYTTSPVVVREALGAGCAVMSIQKKGPFTKGGHYILLVGVINGKIAVNDPASEARSYRMKRKLWPMDTIDKYTRKNVGGKSYTIFWKAPSKAVKKGHKRDDVKKVQVLLKWLGLYSGSIDGHAGYLTDIAIRSYQKKYKLTVDGVFGPKCIANAKKLKL